MDVFPEWGDAFPGFEPVAHRLREVFRDRWVRFHSLPESKRYPESESDFGILLNRHNRVMEWLGATNMPAVLLTTEFTDEMTLPEFHDQSPNAWAWRTGLTEWDSFQHVYATRVTWRPSLFNPVIRRVAVDEISNLMICDSRCRWLVHPYDGGMDVIAENPRMRDLIRAEFNAWLSSHPSGM